MGLSRLLSLLIFGFGLFLLGRDSALMVQGVASGPEALGALWYRVDPAGLNATQAFVQRYLHPAIWNPGITTLLRWPAFVLPLVVGGAWLASDMLSQRRRGRT